MSLLPAFDDDGTGLFDATASWVSSNTAKPSANPKFVAEDFNFDFATFAGAPSSNTQHHFTGDDSIEALFDFKFPSPSLPAPVAFDTGLATLAPVPTAQHQPQPQPQPQPSSSAQLMTAASADANALQLQVTPEQTFTPTGSPHTTSAGYASPSAFQYSPTPGLTMCPTVTSTPAPRSTSRCSSRSPFSHSADGSAAEHAARLPSSAVTVAAAHNHYNNNSPLPKVKKVHLCPFEGCARATRTFRSNADLQRHIRSHRGERPYACPAPNCGKAYGQQNKMVNHVRQQHPALLSVIEVGRSRSARRPGVATAAAAAAAALAASSGSLYPGMAGMMTPGLSAGASAASSVTASPVQTPGPGPAPTMSTLSAHRHAPYHHHHQPAHHALQLAAQMTTPDRRTTAQPVVTGPLFCAVRPQHQHQGGRWLS